ncbi:MAG: alpha/beta hydrolase [Rhodobacteraceae bacterium]|nr:MAG: alpha/beta hydrolase [Paracoccaceae bacterium]
MRSAACPPVSLLGNSRNTRPSRCRTICAPCMPGPMPQLPERLILIHGAWAGPWVWDALIAELARHGLPAQALALPGDGTHHIPPPKATETDFLQCIVQAIEAAPGPVALVGHSGGGMLVTAGAEAVPDKVSHGIWIAGMLIPDGRSFDDIQAQIMGPDARFGITAHVEHSADGLTSTVPKDMARAYFFNDAPEPLAVGAAAQLTCQPRSGHRLRTPTGPRFAALPKLYIHAEHDRSVIPAAQTAMSRSAANVTVQPIASGHVPQLTRPAELAQMMADWLFSRPRSGNPDYDHSAAQAGSTDRAPRKRAQGKSAAPLTTSPRT